MNSFPHILFRAYLYTLKYLIIIHSAFIYFLIYFLWKIMLCAFIRPELNNTMTPLRVYHFWKNMLPCALIPYWAIIRYSRVQILIFKAPLQRTSAWVVNQGFPNSWPTYEHFLSKVCKIIFLQARVWGACIPNLKGPLPI